MAATPFVFLDGELARSADTTGKPGVTCDRHGRGDPGALAHRLVGYPSEFQGQVQYQNRTFSRIGSALD
jgi:hypothetical protein